jgi:transposase
MTDVCREFGISRKTGYKIFNRYREHGCEAFSDRSRRPVRYANQLPPQVESLIVTFKRDKPHWGARKIRELLLRRLASHVRVPAKSTIHAVLDRHGLVKRMGKRRPHATGTPLSQGTVPRRVFKAQGDVGRWLFNLTACTWQHHPHVSGGIDCCLDQHLHPALNTPPGGEIGSPVFMPVGQVSIRAPHDSTIPPLGANWTTHAWSLLSIDATRWTECRSHLVNKAISGNRWTYSCASVPFDTLRRIVRSRDN